MWRNYWTVAVRALAKNKTYSIINIAGLAIGMAACIMILLYVRYEQSYDSWVPDAKNTYQLQTWEPHPKDGDPTFFQMSAYVAKDLIKKDFPQVIGAVYVEGASPVFYSDGQASPTEDYLYSDDDFLKVVNLPLAAGSTLNAAQTAVLTQKEAIKRFGTDQVVGRTFTVITAGATRDFKITGVLKDIPKNSSMRINAILRRDFVAMNADYPQFMTSWGEIDGWIYLKLRPGTDAAALQGQEPAWEKRNIPDEPNGNIRYNHGDEDDWHFVNLRDIHLGKAQGGAMTDGNDRSTIATFAIIAVLILGMAIVNFTNLATARAGQRAREVALRKVQGANRRQLVIQFIAEALLISAVSMLAALALVELLVRSFAAFLNADMTLSYSGSDGILLPAIGVTLLVGVLSGLYPAFFISRFKPAEVLKANRSAAETPGSGRLRTALVIAQFAVSIGLIVCTAVIYGQTVYARSADPGYKRDHILQVNSINAKQLADKGEMIVDRMKRIPGVVAVSRTNIGISTGRTSTTGLIPPGSSRQINIGFYEVDGGFLDAMGLKLVAGRWFDPNRPMDDMTRAFPLDPVLDPVLAKRGVNVVMNELAVKKLGFKSPEDAIGKSVASELFDSSLGLVNITIIGVVNNSRFRSMRIPIEPIMYENMRSHLSWMIIRYNGDPMAMRSAVEQQWKQITNEIPFSAQFSEDIVRDLYKADEARAKVFAAFSLLAVIIGCLGLFGLASFTAERRTKEIGIRKVLGARTRDIVRLLVWQFSQPVLIANVIAWPVAWWVMRDWLNGFDQRVALTPVPFLVAAVVALGIAIGTVMGHAVRIARANPIHALRYE
jgi:putative ABC transport system permease protein